MHRKKILQAADEAVRVATEKGQAALDDAMERITPLVDQAAKAVGPYVHKAEDVVSPVVKQAEDYLHQAQRMARPYVKKAGKYAHKAEKAAQPYLRQAEHYVDETAKALRPIATELFIKGARWAADTMDTWQPKVDRALDQVSPAVESALGRVTPAIDEALAKIRPAVDAAMGKVQDDLLPKFSDALHAAAEHPVAKETSKRLSLATAALAGQLELAPVVPVVIEPAKPKGTFWRTAGKIALAGAALAGAAYALKKLFGPTETGWEAHQASAAYVADPVADVVEDLASPTLSADEVDVVADAGDDLVDELQLTPDDMSQIEGDAVGEEENPPIDPVESEDDAAPFAASPYGEGSWVGSQPPVGFTIKGNERSMKYHLPGSASYERTMTDVWFATAEDAEAAGFTRAQH